MENYVLKSKKIKFDKFFKFTKIIVVLLIVATLAISIFQYTNYLQMQSRAVELMKATSDEYDNYSGSYSELVEEMYFDLNPSYRSGGSVYIDGYGAIEYGDNSGVVAAARDADLALGKALLGDDWFYDSGSKYLQFTGITGYFEFYFWQFGALDDNGLLLISSIISFSLFIIYLILVLLYKMIVNKEIFITDDNVICKTKGKNKKQFMIKDITSVESIFLKGLKFTGNGINHSVLLVQNAEEIKTYVINKLSSN